MVFQHNFFENQWAYTMNCQFRFTISPSSWNREQMRAVFMQIMKVNISADNFLREQEVWLYVIMPMHYLEVKIKYAYSIVLRICRVLEEIWPILPEAQRSWARIPAKLQKKRNFFFQTFLIFLFVFLSPSNLSSSKLSAC